MHHVGHGFPTGKGSLTETGIISVPVGFLPPLTVAAAALLTFSNSYNTCPSSFCYDDVPAIMSNKDVTYLHSLSFLHHDFWGTDLSDPVSHKSYRPLTTLTYRIDYILSGKSMNPCMTRAINILLHALVSALFYLVLRRLVYLFYPSKGLTKKQQPAKDKDKSQDWVCFMTALLFACTPIHADVINFGVGRAELLSALFFLLSILSYTFKGQGLQYVSLELSCIFLGCFAMLSKEQGLFSIPVCIVIEVLLVWFPGTAVSFKKDKGSVRRFLLLALGFLLVTAWRTYIQGTLPEFCSDQNDVAFIKSRIWRALNILHLATFNLYKLFLPLELSYDWSWGSIPLILSWSDYRLWGSLYAAACFISGLILSLHRRVPLAVLSYIFLVIPYLPASNIFFTVGFKIAERVLYLPSMGICLWISWSLATLATRTSRSLSLAISALLISCYVKLSLDRTLQYRSALSLYEATTLVAPTNAMNWFNLAREQTDMINQEKYLRKAIALNPTYVEARNNLANLLMLNGGCEEAQGHFHMALQSKPSYIIAREGLALAMAECGKLEESEKILRSMVEEKVYGECKEPGKGACVTVAELYMNLAYVLERQGRFAEASVIVELSRKLLNS